jgi:hypothetical protein
MSPNIFNSSNRTFKSDKLLQLGEVERILRATLNTVPSRPTLIGYIESGKLRGVRHPFNKYYYVYQSSLDEFIQQFS